MKGLIQLVAIAKTDFCHTLRVAQEESLMFYDVPRLIVTKNREAIIVTGDEEPRKAADRIMKAATCIGFRARVGPVR